MPPRTAEGDPPMPQNTVISALPPPFLVLNIDLKYGAFPTAAKERLIAKEANSFAGNAIHLFSHHVTPVLDLKRKAVLASGKTKKKYSKTAKQLWADVGKGEKEFWEHETWRLRDRLKKGTFTAKRILTDAGDKERWLLYAAHAEVATAGYLHVEIQEWVMALLEPGFGMTGEKAKATEQETEPEKEAHVELEEAKTSVLELTTAPKQHHAMLSDLEKNEKTTVASQDPPAAIDLEAEKDVLLDTLPDIFIVEPKMVYGNFAQLWPYDTIRQAEGWKQISLLRQLADLLDFEGRILFYYYATPHLWLTRPSPVGKTVSSEVHEIWQFMAGNMKQAWKVESSTVKKLLGDGDTEGLESLQLDGSDPVVFRLRSMTDKAIAEDKVKNERT